MDVQKIIVQPDEWASLKEFTAARIALGRTGTAEPLQSLLAFRLAHANARDAVYAVLNQPVLLQELQALQQASFTLTTQAASRSEYLQYPDRGRRLHAKAIEQLTEFNSTGYDVCIVLADGLSATAINNHAIPVLKILLPLFANARLSVAPVCMVQEGRVAIGDECGHLLQAELVVVLIGERPGLSSPDSLGAYLTYRPAPGLTDESRNCISNIRPEGLNYPAAAEKIFFLSNESLTLRLSGVALKDNGGDITAISV
ncbi:ethanolamine ammonia-lyase [Niastella koreensis]|uniref:Ethanolamine ammonia-lyase small subunit n=2 Tax=Niastella koreensis TaxID=354356 RepID=G8TQQ6_NIAKG|nr:ethanolamine ammonia-lyase subunit EutC [Niastella koreensis]AEV96790.1 Ethanolamine ammonia-lyase light chain [Niastella koreensis GR20-10]OQP49144.1 ethanolamine ammonia-lyase [Niastella koreensis]